MYVVPDPRNLFLNGTNAFGTNPFNFEPANSPYFSWKDASQILPGETLVILARWDGHYHVARPTQIAANAALANVPGAALGPADLNSCPGVGCDVASWLFEPVTSGPFVWHCHINSHEDSEMMRTSLVVP
jgi:FtsP/CotA-like multicopper oxidase with cupredoxin domain